MSWSNGYFADLAYSFGYYPELSPAMLKLACLSQAIDPQVPDDPCYLELGFGQGVSINIHAAANAGSYWGTDFNPAQVVESRRLAAASGADIHLLNDSFEELAARPELPDFDIIVLHGIWSWISDSARAAIMDIIRRKLRPGGIVYISYNCMPGWAPILPIRQLMRLYRSREAGGMSDPIEVIQNALQLCDSVAKAGSKYFHDNPSARNHLDGLFQQGYSYIGHEFMNEDWQLPHFAEMVHSLDTAKLSFVGSAHLLDGIDSLQVTPDGRKLLSQFSHPIMRETVRDYLTNRRFRSDIFVKGPRRMSGPEHSDAWHAQRFVLSRPVADLPRAIQCGAGELKLPPERCSPIIAALAEDGCRPKRVSEICDYSASKVLTPQDIVETLMVLVGAGFASPAQDPSDKILKHCRSLNAHILTRAQHSMELCHMVSPVTGGGFVVAHMTQLLILSHREGHADAETITNNVWRFLDNIDERLMKDGKRIESKEDNLREIRLLTERFLTHALPALKALRIVE